MTFNASEPETPVRSEDKIFTKFFIWCSLCSFVLGGTATAAGLCYEQTFLVMCGIVVMGPVTCVLLFILLVAKKCVLADKEDVLPENNTTEPVSSQLPPPGYDDCVRGQVIVNVIESDDPSVLSNDSRNISNNGVSLNAAAAAVSVSEISDVGLAKQLQALHNTGRRNERPSVCSCKSDESNPPSYDFVVENHHVI